MIKSLCYVALISLTLFGVSYSQDCTGDVDICLNCITVGVCTAGELTDNTTDCNATSQFCTGGACGDLPAGCDCDQIGEVCETDPNSDADYIDCRPEASEIFKPCENPGELHIGSCQCSPETVDCTAIACDYIETTSDCPWYVACEFPISPPNACPGSLCFSEEACECVEATVEKCTGECPTFEYTFPDPNGCARYAFCDDPDETPYDCQSGTCYSPTECTCVDPITLTTTTTPSPVECPCGYLPIEGDNDCSTYYDCITGSQDEVQSCTNGCYNQVDCSCDVSTDEITPTTAAGTPEPGSTISQTSTTSTTSTISTTAASVCSTCDYFALSPEDDCPKDYVSCIDAAQYTCPGELCYDESTCLCGQLDLCPSCGFIEDSDTSTCNGYVDCENSGAATIYCPLDYCFNPSFCSCA